MQHRHILREVDISEKELKSLVASMCLVLKTVDKASKCTEIRLPKLENEPASKIFKKDNLFAHYCKDIIEHRNRQIRLSF